MKKAILGKKIGMLQVWNDEGKRIPVTAIQAGPCNVVQVKKPEGEGYSAVQIGYDTISKDKERLLSKAARGHQKGCFEKTGNYSRVLREIVNYPEEVSIGDTIDCSLFEEGDKVTVRSTSKGKGFQGVVRRYNFAGGPKTHGSHFHRIPGAVGAGTYPGRVSKGKKMPGRMGGKKKTILNLEVVRVQKDENLLLIKGAVPGAPGEVVFIYTN